MTGLRLKRLVPGGGASMKAILRLRCGATVEGELADARYIQPGPIDVILGVVVVTLLTESAAERMLNIADRWRRAQLGWLVLVGLQVPGT